MHKDLSTSSAATRTGHFLAIHGPSCKAHPALDFHALLPMDFVLELRFQAAISRFLLLFYCLLTFVCFLLVFSVNLAQILLISSVKLFSCLPTCLQLHQSKRGNRNLRIYSVCHTDIESSNPFLSFWHKL
ncbi:hypothetical protein O6H91_11G093400 [Diphasiastrum complanatum]|uniref:Uncharacterized protein n=1 Tax=Diphasiastrum complanatum TaxID=34168 RepID=A0ACC2CBS9_DIPCM|nr:hypothetical protein O6H91_11G093400 [Diphasiastrum complanatum]